MAHEWVRVAGIIAAVTSAGVGVADVLLLVARGPSATEIGLGVMRGVGWNRLCWGGTLGAVLLPVLGGASAYHVYFALAPAGTRIAAAAALLLGYFFGLGAAAHGAFPYIGAVLQRRDVAHDDAAAREALGSVYQRHVTLLFAVGTVVVVVFVSAGICFTAAVASGKSYYPAVMALLSPFVVAIICLFSPGFLPPVLYRVLRPAFVHVAFAPFFAYSTWLTWSR